MIGLALNEGLRFGKEEWRVREKSAVRCGKVCCPNAGAESSVSRSGCAVLGGWCSAIAVQILCYPIYLSIAILVRKSTKMNYPAIQQQSGGRLDRLGVRRPSRSEVSIPTVRRMGNFAELVKCKIRLLLDPRLF